jgi:hypothetical protein
LVAEWYLLDDRRLLRRGRLGHQGIAKEVGQPLLPGLAIIAKILACGAGQHAPHSGIQLEDRSVVSVDRPHVLLERPLRDPRRLRRVDRLLTDGDKSLHRDEKPKRICGRVASSRLSQVHARSEPVGGVVRSSGEGLTEARNLRRAHPAACQDRGDLPRIDLVRPKMRGRLSVQEWGSGPPHAQIPRCHRQHVYVIWLSPRTTVRDQSGQAPKGNDQKGTTGANQPGQAWDALEVGDRVEITYTAREPSYSANNSHRHKHGRHRIRFGDAISVTVLSQPAHHDQQGDANKESK